MSYSLIQIASAETGNKDLFSVLGIDWRLLILQSIAFLILVLLLRKFVYPPLLKSLDNRQKIIEESLQAAKKTEENAAKAQNDIDKSLKKAQTEASEILATAKAEASARIEEAEQKAKIRAERLTQKAHEQLQQDIEIARKTLRKDTVELVAMATEKIVRQKIDAKSDQEVINSVLEEAQ